MGDQAGERRDQAAAAAAHGALAALVALELGGPRFETMISGEESGTYPPYRRRWA